MRLNQSTHKLIYNMSFLGLSQKSIADCVGLSQPRVSQVLRKYTPKIKLKPTKQRNPSKLDYLTYGVFERRVHREIYEMHVNRVTQQQIYERLKADPIFSDEIKPGTVGYVIRNHNKRLQALHE